MRQKEEKVAEEADRIKAMEMHERTVRGHLKVLLEKELVLCCPRVGCRAPFTDFTGLHPIT